MIRSSWLTISDARPQVVVFATCKRRAAIVVVSSDIDSTLCARFFAGPPLKRPQEASGMDFGTWIHDRFCFSFAE
jgi:hypothetical protein